MFERLIRIGFAFVVAFVFTGRMEAATAHCLRLVHAETAAAAPIEAAACHEDAGDDVAMQAASPHAKSSHGKSEHDGAGDRCECIGVLKACASVPAAGEAMRLEPYEWVQTEAAMFISVAPSPALRPPRA